MFDIGFFYKAILGGIGVAFAMGPLGCFVIWKRLAYFGDTLAHSALFGVSIALFFDINNYFGLFISCILVVVALGIINRKKSISNDTILGILSHSSLAIGLIFISIIKNVNVDLLSYLYGDILTISNEDLFYIYSIAIFTILTLLFSWNKLISIVVCRDLAKVEGIKVEFFHWLLFILMSLVFAVSVKLVGILLITALLVIPAASARFISSSPEQMAFFSVIFGIISVSLGMFCSITWDWPSGPSIVLVGLLIFIISFCFSSILKK